MYLQDKRIAEAMEYMVFKHYGQKYGDMPYYTHPLEVSAVIVAAFDDWTETEIIAALLHDVVEDTDGTLEEIESLFGNLVAEAVELLTKNNSLTYDENISRIIESGYLPAIRVKWADNFVNMNGDKSHMTEERRDRLNTKYQQSFVRLSEALGMK